MPSTPPSTHTPAAVSALDSLSLSFQRSLRAANKAPQTVRTYLQALRLFGAYLAAQGMPQEVAHIRREHVEAFIAAQVERSKPATAHSRYRALHLFFKWCIEEGEIKQSPMAHMQPPRVPETPAPVLSEEQLKRLLTVCEGTDFRARRDTAILRLLIDSGMRLSEIAGLRMSDLDMENDLAYVLGKGRRPRACPFGRKT